MASYIKKLAITLLLCVTGYIAYSGLLDSEARSYTEQGMQRTLIVFALSRGLNGVISVAQGTELAVAPAGLGLNFAPGQILDPLNDLIERFSWVVLASSASFGIQNMLLEITGNPLLSVFLLGIIFITLVIYWLPRQWQSNTTQSVMPWLYKSLIIVVALRLVVPVIALANQLIYEHYMQPKYERAYQGLENSLDTLEQANQMHLSQDVKAEEGERNFIDQAKQWFNQASISEKLEQQIDEFKQVSDDASQRVIDLIVVFVMQSVLLPLLFLWAVVKGVKRLLVYGLD